MVLSWEDYEMGLGWVVQSRCLSVTCFCAYFEYLGRYQDDLVVRSTRLVLIFVREAPIVAWISSHRIIRYMEVTQMRSTVR